MRYLSDKQVADVLGVSVSTISRIMNGRFGKNGQVLIGVKHFKVGDGRRWESGSLAQALGVSEDDLFARKDQ